MGHCKSLFTSLFHPVHERFIWLLLGSYATAAAFPSFGLWLKSVSFGEIVLFRETTKITLPVLMLAFLLLNAGLGVQFSGLRNLATSPLPLLCGLFGNILIPIAFIFAVSQTLRFWHNADEVQNILVGLALIASMPIAGSSTAWSQNANGDMSLSLGLVLLSTFLSPWTTPLALHAVGFMTTGDYAEDLHQLAESGTGSFLALCVLFPSLLGIMLGITVGKKAIASIKPGLKLANSIILLILNYSNASVSLPQTVTDADWDFLAIVLGIVSTLCLSSFASGGIIAHFLKADVTQRVSLMFGLGMNNNGTGLVLASMALADHPRVLLPIIFYNLAQHLVAGSVAFLLGRVRTGDNNCGNFKQKSVSPMLNKLIPF